MNRKITVIGAGNVGSTIAYTLSNSDITNEIVLIDIDNKKVKGEVMDIVQGVSFRDPISIIAGEYEDAKNSDIVIITSGMGRKVGQTRLELTRANVDVLKEITPNIVKYAPNALYIIVSNPVDIMTYIFTKISGLNEKQIIGSGTLLDTARLRCALSNHFNISQRNIHAYVFGEHGDSSFVPWSFAKVSGAGMDEYYEMIKKYNTKILPVNKEEILKYIHTSGGEIIKNKGATYYAVSVAVCRLCNILLSAYDSVITVSTVLKGEYGINDVALSVPTVIGPEGVKCKIEIKLTDEELKKLNNSAETLKEVLRDLV